MLIYIILNKLSNNYLSICVVHLGTIRELFYLLLHSYNSYTVDSIKMLFFSCKKRHHVEHHDNVYKWCFTMVLFYFTMVCFFWQCLKKYNCFKQYVYTLMLTAHEFSELQTELLDVCGGPKEETYGGHFCTTMYYVKYLFIYEC